MTPLLIILLILLAITLAVRLKNQKKTHREIPSNVRLVTRSPEGGLLVAVEGLQQDMGEVNPSASDKSVPVIDEFLMGKITPAVMRKRLIAVGYTEPQANAMLAAAVQAKTQAGL